MANRVNLVLNPTFESGVTNWTSAYTGTLTKVTAQQHSGTSSMKYTQAASAGTTNIYCAAIAATPGLAYTASAYLRIPSSSPSSFIPVQLLFYNSSLALIGTFSSGSLTSSGNSNVWTRYSATGTAPAGTAYVLISIFNSVTTLANYAFWIDDVMVEQSATLGSYFDGSTTADGSYTYSWSGTAGASTSIATPVAGVTPSSTWIRRTVVSAASNGTTSHTLTYAAATALNVLVAVVSGAVTFSTPTDNGGWTLVASAANNTGLYVFTKVAVAGETSFTTTHNGSDYPVLGVVYEYPAGTVVVGTAGSSTTLAKTATLPLATGLTGTYTSFAARSWGSNAVSTTFAYAWTTPGKDFDAYNAGGNGSSLSIASQDGQTASTVTPNSTLTTTGTVPTTGEGVTFALSIGSGAPSGTASKVNVAGVQTTAADKVNVAGVLTAATPKVNVAGTLT